MDLVYLDHSATTPVRPDVLEVMLPYLNASWGNPSSAHRFGRAARAGLEQGKRETAEALGVEPNQVIFTSGGTEADNLALIGAALAARAHGRRMHVVTTAIEHKAVLAACHAVVSLGGEETVLGVDADGIVRMDELDAALREEPALVSVMWVNNEVGVVQPMVEIGARCRQAAAPLHSDAVQALGKLPIDLDAVNCTLLSISGHKIGAPKGIGALIVRDRKIVEAIIHGGGQQYGIRPGTENVAGAVALGRAALLARRELDDHVKRLGAMRADLVARLVRVSARPDRACRRGRARSAHRLRVGSGRGSRSAADASRPRRHRLLGRFRLLDWRGRAVARPGRNGCRPESCARNSALLAGP